MKRSPVRVRLEAQGKAPAKAGAFFISAPFPPPVNERYFPEYFNGLTALYYLPFSAPRRRAAETVS